MKKLFFVAVAAIAMTACSNEDVVLVENASQEIGFNAANYSVSRNTPADGTTFSTSNKMIVSAVYTDNDDTKAPYTYFEGVTCTHKADGNWHSGYLWPLEGTMKFGAYSTDLGLDLENNPDNAVWAYDTDKSLKTLTLDMTTQKLGGHEDLLYSDIASADCKKKSDGTNDPVPVNFRHALAWIYVNLNTTDDAANNVKIYDVRVNGVSLSGKALITFGTPSTVAWSDLTTAPATTSIAATPAEKEINATAYAWGNGLLLPKQNQTSITIEYDIMANGSAYTGNHMTYTHTLTSSDEWVDGNKYTYNITIGLNEITFTGKVTDFTDAEVDPIEI